MMLMFPNEWLHFLCLSAESDTDSVHSEEDSKEVCEQLLQNISSKKKTSYLCSGRFEQREGRWRLLSWHSIYQNLSVNI